MAQSESLVHWSAEGWIESDWQRFGDIPASGPDIDSIMAALKNSEQHRRILLDPGYTDIGVGVASAEDGTLYIAAEFVERA